MGLLQASSHPHEPIAVIGSACRFPGLLNNPSKLWEFLRKPRDLLSKIPKERFNPDVFYHPDGMHHGASNVTESYLLKEDHRAFDAGFFNIKPVEAHSIDPQQRLLMETVYESLETAGLSIESMAGSQTAVYVGLMCGDFSEHLQRDVDSLPTYMPTGTARSIMSNRISYFFDWHGPSMTIDTACSSSLVAVHQAVQQLRTGESDVVIAAGANLILGPELYIGEAKLKMLSPGSRSRMWDVDADGYARGEGIASVVLKRLSDALRDGDHIDCIIRESGVNQDGKTKGITMPNELAQADLIEKTYAKAGLNPKNKNERCQFFEAHGTGTSAGDAREAEGISRAFFGPNFGNSDAEDILHVGSIKTVIGHTEGTAGLAGLLKASLALQHSIIPPNMLFKTLNPTVAPFYNNLNIATLAKPWPQVEGARRASVNSFGFGGTNAHVILENYESPSQVLSKSEGTSFAPFVFSAVSEKALEATFTAYSTHLRSNPDISLRDLAFTLHSRRSTFGVRAAFAAASAERLADKIDERLQVAKSNSKGQDVGVRPTNVAPSVLGVFTGQGAQWAQMGRQLILSSASVSQSLEELDSTLQTLPECDRPSWSLVDELLAHPSQSRIGEAAISQPLCTALQIVLVDLIQSAGIKFSGVVGHSSGEMAAAYAAGFITRYEAIKIAYYRGLFTKLAGQDQPGAMMAVGTSFEDANDLCSLETFEGRLCVAACNSSSSVTLSGDADAIEEAKVIMADEKKFARILKVDKAYHSHHMLPCAGPYVDALHKCNIQPQMPRDGCNWYSSTYEGVKMETQEELKGAYWKDNMVSPVLFAQAVEAVASQREFNLVIEVGPHPALKGPVLQTLQSIDNQTPAYTSLLSRGRNDVEAFADALGFIWTRFNPVPLQLKSFDSFITGNEQRQLITSLPSYQWDHERIFWHETRLSRMHRNRKDPLHSLLGSRVAEGTEEEMRWRNILRPTELPWVRGHQLQNQMVFPAAGYVSTAIESANSLVEGRPISMIEVSDFVIEKALAFDDEQSGVETLFALSEITKDKAEELYSATFRYYAWINQESDNLSLLASGKLAVTVGEAGDVLPTRSAEQPNMAAVREDQFYSSLDDLGYGYSGDFRCLTSMKRKLNYGSAYASVPYQEPADAVLVHPALLDVAFQSIFLAYWWPNDGSLDQLHVPTRISSIKLNVSLAKQDLIPGSQVPLDSYLTDNPLTTSLIRGDVDVFGADARSTMIQVQGVEVVAFSEASPDMDWQLFSEHVWGLATVDAEAAVVPRATPEDYELGWNLERVSLFYMRKLEADVVPEQRTNLEWHHEALFDFTSHIISQTSRGKQRFMKQEWVRDTWEVIKPIIDKYPDSIEMKLTCTVGENLAASVRGETAILQYLLGDGLLNKYYTDAMGLKELTESLALTVAQVVHRYPHMNILEIGAGTGGATKSIMKRIGRAFSSYTYTDISTGFFETAQTFFTEQGDRMIFKALDIEKDTAEQGYADHSFDLIIGSLVLHATQSLKKTMENTRRLLKPGGYLIILEITSNDVVRTGFAMSGLPGWWLGRNDGRRFSPCVSSAEWHNVLLQTGFSGIDSISPEDEILPRPLSVIVSQGVTDEVNLLRQPLLYPGQCLGENKDWGLVVIGGQTLRTVRLIDEVLQLLQPWYLSVTRFKSLHDVDPTMISPGSVVLSVTELDRPIFEDFEPDTMEGLKRLFDYQRTILWVTQGCRADEPYMNMTVGFGRSLALEAQNIQLQFLDLDISRKPDARLLVESLLRLQLTEGSDILWTTEQEIAQEGAALVIPRLMVNKEQNNRYNAGKRPIYGKSTPHSTVDLQPTSSGYTLVHRDIHVEPDESVVLASYSTVNPLLGSLYGVIGTDKATGSTVVGLSTNNGSSVGVAESRLVEWKHANEQDASRLLFLLFVDIEVDSILSVSPRNGTVLIYKPTAELAERLQRRAQEKGIKIFFASSNSTNESWITIHKNSPKRLVKATVPANLSLFIDYSNNDEAGRLISSCLPKTCSRTTPTEIGNHANLTEEDAIDRLRDVLDKLAETADSTLFSPVLVKPEDLATYNDTSAFSVIDWADASQLPVRVTSVEAHTRFDANKTYVLFGLTSDLGQSLCDWMAAHGARNIVLTSRNPKIDERWLKQMEDAGVRLKVYSNDITDQAAVEEIVAEIRRTFPPIAGIAQGAMVLEDTAFFEMSFETMNKVLRPKVLGTIYLDALFQKDELDFFIFFSSLASVSGNRGQSNYSAANMFMTAITNQRQRKGLAASVLHIGAVMGVGYVMREVSETVFPAIRRAGFVWMPERGFHQCFAEAIISGRPYSGRNPEIVTGLRLINANEEEPAPWMNIPRFQHCINRSGDQASKKANSDATVSVKAGLQGATTQEEAREIIQNAFFSKLQAALQLQLDDESARKQVLNSGADELGVDSLVAVEIRSWFLKELEVDMPVLKILGGATIGDLLIFALDKLPEHLFPNMGKITDAVNLIKVETYAPVPPSLASDTVTSKSVSNAEDSLESSITVPSPPRDSIMSTASSEDLGKCGDGSLTPTSDNEYQKIVPMSFGQSRFWFLKHYLEDPTTFNITFSTRLKGALRVHDLENAVRVVGDRHEALRTCFFVEDGQRPMQGVLRASSLQLEKKSIQGQSDVNREFDAMKNHVFAIEQGEIMRVLLLSQSPTNHVLIIGYHHINMDGVSLEIFLADLEKAYTHRPFAPRVFQYSDFSLRQQKEIESGQMQTEMDFWKAEFANAPPALPLLPFAATQSRSAIVKYEHYREDIRIPPQLAEQIKGMCKKQKASLFHFYFAVYEVMLFRLLGVEDLAIGMADANRNDDALTTSMGMYLNLLPLRFRLGAQQQFTDVLKDTRRKAYGAMAHSRLPFDVLLDELKVPRSTQYSPLFQAFINYRQGVQEKRTFGGLDGEGEEYSLGKTAYDISLDILDNPGSSTLLMFIVQKQLYSAEDARQLCRTYVNLLDHFSNDPTRRLSEPTLFVTEDIEKGIQLGAGPMRNSEWPETLPHRVDQMIESYPDSIALKDTHGNEWTYKQLAGRTDIIASALLGANIEPRAPVGVYVEPSADWICTLLAVMRVGATYIPLDVNTPVSRLATMVKSAQPSAVVAHNATVGDVDCLYLPAQTTIINLDTVSTELPASKVEVKAEASYPAVILYTSGTTGVPKGVILSHEGLRNENEFEIISGPEVVLQQSALSFDLSLNQVFTALAWGGKLIIAPRSMRGDSVAITKLISQENVTYTGATPSEYLSWLQYGRNYLVQNKGWKFAMSCGEQYPLKLVNEFRSLNLPELSLWNAYGPSESTLSSNRALIPTGHDTLQRVPVGQSLTNCAVYIVDRDLKALPVGMPGEVCIAGAGVAMGYLNNEERNSKNFLWNPFASSHFITNGWQRMYRTGDKGRLLPDGSLDLLGRIDGDTQIKLRGIRIEMQDIESTILRESNGALSEAVVMPRGDPPILVAHAVLSPSASVDDGQFLQRLAASLPLPQYMKPAAIIPIPSMPLTAHGKIDRKAVQSLPITQAISKSSPTSNLTEMESRLRQAWETVLSAEVLQLYTIDANTDFFHVGGNSMLLINLQSLIQKEFYVSLTIMRLFESSTLGAMATAIQDSSTPQAAIINWDEETAVSDSLIDLASLASAIDLRTSPRSVVLTGSTGFLGRQILNQLVASPTVETIHCIAVRDESKLSEFTSSGKVSIYRGDLSTSQFGLSDEAAQAIFSQADAIIHNGADVSFLKTYQSLKRPNVDSTKELVRLSLAHGRIVPYHFISTVTTGRLSKSDTLGEVSLAAFPPPPGFPDGYVSSKWASEVFLERASKTFNLPVYIHRPSSITGEGASELDIMHSMLKYARITRSVPQSPHWRGYLDFISVETVADGIIQEVIKANPTKSLVFLLHSGEMITTMEYFKGYLENESGDTYTALSLGEWIERAKGAGLNPLVAGYLSATDEKQVDVVFQRLVKLRIA